MKKMKLLVGMAIFAALAFTGIRADAFPLTLTSVKGTITSTRNYGVNATTTSNVVSKVAITLPTIITVLSNEVFLDLGTVPPSDLRIALNPYTGSLYLTNSGGFFYDIEGKGLGSFRISETATTFSRTSTTFTEQDVMLVRLEFNGRQPNGESFEISLRGYATLKYQLDSAGVGKMNVSSKTIAGYGEFNSSDSGVSWGSFKATGTGTPEWVGPFSVFWWNR